MATQFDILFAGMAAPVLADQFGEPVTYQPRGGGSRPVTAIRVVRKPVDKLANVEEARQPVIEVEFYNDNVLGISSAEIDLGGDTLVVAARLGATDQENGPIARRITRLLSDWAGITRVEVR